MARERAAKEEFFKTATGRWQWRVVASNGKIINTPGEDFSSKNKAEQNFNRVKEFFKTGR